MSEKPFVSRRALLRGATIAAPTILTFHSGAALARSSNLVSTSWNASPSGNAYNCLDTGSVKPTTTPNKYDAGQPAYAHVTRITADKEYRKIDWSSGSGDGAWSDKVWSDNNLSPTNVTPQQMCAEGGWYVRNDSGYSVGGWTPVQVKPGGMLSAAAMSSIAAGANYTDV